MMEMNKIMGWFKYLLLLGLTFFVYYILQSLLILPFMGIINDIGNLLKSLILLGSEVILLVVLFLIYHKLIIKDFIKNWKKYIPKGLLYWVIGFIGMGFMNILITFTVGSDVATNEALNREMITKLPLYAIPVIAFIGPIVEEIVFRFSFRKVIPNKFLYIVITSIIFAGVHMTASFDSFSAIWSDIPEFLHIFAYLSLALSFSFAYRDTDNIFTTMCLHILHNTYCLAIIIMGLLV